LQYPAILWLTDRLHVTLIGIPDFGATKEFIMRQLLVSMIIILIGADTFAAVVLDQEHNTPTAVADSTNGSVSEVAQTFTVGIAGTLDHIDISMFQLGSIFATNGDPKLSVYNTTGGVPSGAPLTTIQVPTVLVPFNTAAFVTFDVSAAAIPVSVGDVLAFGVSTLSDPGPYFLPEDPDTGVVGNYSGGAAYRRTLPSQPWQLLQPSQDHEFRTFVNAVPEPSTFTLLAFGGIFLHRMRRANQSKPRLPRTTKAASKPLCCGR
jgi:hypothetical protein